MFVIERKDLWKLANYLQKSSKHETNTEIRGQLIKTRLSLTSLGGLLEKKNRDYKKYYEVGV